MNAHPLDSPADAASLLRPEPTIAVGRMLPDAVFGQRVDAGLRTWMLHDGSLTDRIAAAFGAVRVTPLVGRIGPPTAQEAALLAERAGGGWWIREIVLAAGGQARLRARTLVPPTSRRLQQRLRGLGATPLGRALFHRDRLRPEVRRGLRRFARASDGRWLRLTAYDVAGESLLVIERMLVDGAHDAGTRAVPARHRR